MNSFRNPQKSLAGYRQQYQSFRHLIGKKIAFNSVVMTKSHLVYLDQLKDCDWLPTLKEKIKPKTAILELAEKVALNCLIRQVDFYHNQPE